MPNTLTAIPATITAGDSYAITLSLTEYPAPTWALSYAIAGPSVQSWTSTASGDVHLLTLTAAETAALGAGTYQFRVRATRSGDVVTVQTGVQTVVADIGRAAPSEYVSWAQRTLAVVEAALSNTLTGEMKMYMIWGRQVQTFTPDELFKARARLKAEIAQTQTRTFGVPVRFDVMGMR